MTIGIALPGGLEPTVNAVDTYIEYAEQAAAAGLTAVWFSQRADADALTLAAVIGARVPGIAVGTSVVPIYPRHPLVVAAQTNTAVAASHGRFTLGLGLGAPALLAQAYGTDVDRPIRHLREYLTVLDEVLEHGSVEFTGDSIVARTPRPTSLAGASRPSIVVAAMGPQALQVTGELADGTLPYLAGPRTLEEFIVPRITESAERAGRPAPRIVVALAAVVTDDVAAVHARIAEQSAFYATVPSYRAVLEREGLTDPADLAVVGDEAALAAAVERYRAAGATEIVLTNTAMDGDESRSRTWAAAGALSVPT